MTKLLYIPTGEYITFYGNDGELTNIIEKLNKHEYIGFTHNNIIKSIISISNNGSSLYERNKIKIPVVKEEFEVIYD